MLTHGSPGQTHDHARRCDFVHALHCEHRLPYKVLQVFRCHLHCLGLPTYDLVCSLAQHLQWMDVGGDLLGRGMPLVVGRPVGRLTFSTCFCRLRTPLSLQYCLMSRVSTAADSWALLSSRPHRVRACGTRYRCGEQLSATPLAPTHHTVTGALGSQSHPLHQLSPPSQKQRSRLTPVPQAPSVNPGCGHLRHHLPGTQDYCGRQA